MTKLLDEIHPGEILLEDFMKPLGNPTPEAPAATLATTARMPWPKDLTDQVRAIADTLARALAPLSESELADRFTGRGRWRERLPRILDMLVALGNVKQADGRYRRV